MAKEETPILGWIVAGVIGLAVGVFLGLGVAKLTGRTLAEQDKVIAEQKQVIEQLEIEKANLAGKQEEHLELLSQAKAEIKVTDKIAQTSIGSHLKSQALLDMILREPAVREMMLHPEFQDKFKADWYMPAMAFKAIGGRWFFEELAQRGVISQEMLAKTPPQSEGSWKTVREWRVTGSKNTEAFAMTSDIWRLSWQSGDIGVIVVVKRETDGETVGSANGQGNDSTLIRLPPGKFYLEIQAFDPTTITVAQPE